MKNTSLYFKTALLLAAILLTGVATGPGIGEVVAPKETTSAVRTQKKVIAKPKAKNEKEQAGSAKTTEKTSGPKTTGQTSGSKITRQTSGSKVTKQTSDSKVTRESSGSKITRETSGSKVIRQTGTKDRSSTDRVIKIEKKTTPPVINRKTEQVIQNQDRVKIEQSNKNLQTSIQNVKPGMLDHSAKLPSLGGITIQLLAGTSDKNPSQVILKWVLDGTWLSPNGYNIYRKGPGDSDFQKIGGPIKEQNGGNVTIRTTKGKTKTVNLADLQQKARNPIKFIDQSQKIFEPTQGNIESSKPAFEELKQLRIKSNSAFTGKTRASMQPVNMQNFQKLENFYRRFSIPACSTLEKAASTGSAAVKNVSMKNVKLAQAGAAKTQEQNTLEARQGLLLASMVDNAIGKTLGLCYFDSNLQPGATYEYQLRENSSAGADKASASVTITVGADPLPAKPTGLDAAQRDTKSVDLRWDLDKTQSAARVISYDIFRTSSGKRVQVNGQRLMVGPVQDQDGKYVDPIFYFTDPDVPIGQVKYELVGYDVFNRETPPATLDFEMKDWETPDPVTYVKGTENNGTVYIYWRPSARKGYVPPSGIHTMVPPVPPDENAMYNIYRMDTERGNKEWVKLNDNPIKPSYTPPPASNGSNPVSIPEALKSTFIDNTAAKDSHYLYCVRSLYQKNLIEAAPSPVEPVAVPDLSKPARVQELVSSFEPAVKQPQQLTIDRRWMQNFTKPKALNAKITNLHADPAALKSAEDMRVKSIVNNAAKVATMAGSAAKSLEVKPASVASQMNPVYASLTKADPNNSDLGGKVILKWKPAQLTGPIKYRIYRANASGFFANDSSASIVQEDVDIPGGAAKTVTQSSAKNKSKASSTMTVEQSKASLSKEPAGVVRLRNTSFSYKKAVDVEKFLKFELIAETRAATFVDPLPKSRPMYYNYRVTVVNRWGVEGLVASLPVRVPSTIKPPTPEVVAAYPEAGGGIVINWKPLDEKEECEKYLVYRKLIPIEMFLQFMPGAQQSKIEDDVRDIPGGSIIELAALGAIQAQTTTSKAKTATKAKTVTKTTATGAASANLAADTQAAALPISADVSGKTRKLGMRVRTGLSRSNAQFFKEIRDLLGRPDYERVGEADPADRDQNGYVRFIDTKDLEANKLYSYLVVAQDVDDWRSEASQPLLASPYDVTAPPVTNLHASADSNGRGIQLTWQAPQGDILGYVVKRGVGGNTNFIQISGTLKDLKYVDFSVVRGVKYTYKVFTIDSIGNMSEAKTVEFTLPK